MAFIHNLLLILGRGIGQVMFQNNALSGLLMLTGIFLNSWQMGILAVCGNIISTLTAYFSGYKHNDITYKTIKILFNTIIFAYIMLVYIFS